MSQFRKQATGFAVVGACVALTGTAFAAGGDDPFTSTTITSLPFADTGNTADGTFTDQFDVVCPFTGSTSPDAWYNITPMMDVALAVDLCNSGYDTKTYILDAGFNDIGCNDDACTSPSGGAFRSLLENVIVSAGDLVYIVVDGWSGDAGVYDITVTGSEPPEECSAADDCDGTDEGEVCDEVAPDTTNGGCNSSPNVFSNVSCGDTVCGNAWALGGLRDTDWYILAAEEGNAFVSYNGTVEFDAAMFFLGVDPDCATVAVISSVFPLSCESATLGADVPAGSESWWFMGKVDFDGLPCTGAPPQGNDYIASWTCGDAPCPALGDLDGDGDVDFNDLLVVLANWGDCP